MNRKAWTPRELELLEILFPHLPTEAVAWKLRRKVYSVNNAAYKLGLHKTAEHMASPEACLLRRKDVGFHNRFPKGHVPANKGLRRPGYAPGRMAETQFKPGQLNGAAAALHRPVGTIVADPEGFLRIKIRERVAGSKEGGWHKLIWPLVHWRVWEQHHGPIPPGHKVAFRDGNRAHCDIDNLELITNAEMMRRNSVHNLPQELKEVIQLNGALKRKIRRLLRGKEQNDGPAQSPVRDAGSAARRGEAYGHPAGESRV